MLQLIQQKCNPVKYAVLGCRAPCRSSIHHDGSASAWEQLCQSKVLLLQLFASSSLPKVTDLTALPAAQVVGTFPNPLQAKN